MRDQARATRSFDLMPEEGGESHGINFIPGQVAVLKVEGEDPAYFAFASAPGDVELEVLVKQKVGVSNLIFEMKPGERIQLLDVAGHGFALDEHRGKDLVLSLWEPCGPLRSALRDVLKRQCDFGRW